MLFPPELKMLFRLPSEKQYYAKKTASHNTPESGDSVVNLSGENPQARFPSDKLYSVGTHK